VNLKDENQPRNKLIITIVRKGLATKIISASKKAGSKGGTTVFGKGTADKKTYENLLGIPYEPEKEIIFIIVENSLIKDVLSSVTDVGKLNKKGYGIAFVIDIRKCIGVLATNKTYNEEERLMDKERKYDLIVTIVNKGRALEVVDASKKAGAEGGTIINGRGSGIHENARVFGIVIEPEKELVLILVEKESSSTVLATIKDDLDLENSGNGIAFVLGIENTVGML
jgi:nitrogen regulatory protein PII